MAFPFSNAAHPFGSARFAEPKEIAGAGMLSRAPHSLLVGFLGKRLLTYSAMGGAVCVAGARSGKLRDLLAYNICCGIHAPTMVILDVKGELAAISQNQTPDHKFCIYWNPAALHGLPRHRINPVDYIRSDSPTLVSDTKVFAENMIPPSGSPQSEYFEGRAREFLEALVLTLTRLHGALSLPDIYRAINLVVIGGEKWLDLAFDMSASGFDQAERIEEEIAAGRDDSSGGFRGILGELTKAFSCLSDPVLLDSVSPPFDFSLSQLCESEQTYNLYLMPPSEFVEAWAPIIKSIFVAARTYKARTPSAPRQTWILDECGQLGGFPLVIRLFTRDAGLGIRPWAFFQSTKQMKALGPDGENLILSSAALRSFFGVRDEDSAATISRMLGDQTLAYIDPHRRAAALHAKSRAVRAIIGGGDPFKAGMEIAHQSRLADLPVLRPRRLLSTDEILGMPPGRQIIFADGLSHAIYAERRAYFDQRFMAGRYHPNPYFPPDSHVRVRTRWGYRWRRVVVEPVPRAFAHYPQYAHGHWSRIG